MSTTIWSTNDQRAYTTASTGDSLLVLPGVSALLQNTNEIIALRHASQFVNHGSLIAIG